VSLPLTLAQAAPLLGCRDPRTARRRLAELGVPVEVYGRRIYVDEAEILRARRAHARVERADGGQARPGGVILARGARLWDGAGARPKVASHPRQRGGGAR
jgi:hypothetical protein